MVHSWVKWVVLEQELWLKVLMVQVEQKLTKKLHNKNQLRKKKLITISNYLSLTLLAKSKLSRRSEQFSAWDLKKLKRLLRARLFGLKRKLQRKKQKLSQTNSPLLELRFDWLELFFTIYQGKYCCNLCYICILF